MAIAGDTFVEASDTALGSHTPTGPNAGTSWTVVSSGSAAKILGGQSKAADDDATGDNDCRMNTDLGSDEMYVQGDLGHADATFHFPGLSGRYAAAGTSPVVIVIYNNDSGQWDLYESGSLRGSYAEAWTGSPARTVRLEIQSGEIRVYITGVLRITYTATIGGAGNQYAGMGLGNFSSGATGVVTIANYTSGSYPPPGAAPRRSRQMLMGVGG